MTHLVHYIAVHCGVCWVITHRCVSFCCVILAQMDGWTNLTSVSLVSAAQTGALVYVSIVIEGYADADITTAQWFVVVLQLHAPSMIGC